MNFLILGDGPDEQAWADAIASTPGHAVIALFPGFANRLDQPHARDMDDALAASGLEAAIIGGAPEFRAEALRRVAAIGLPAICLHPPGPDSEAYYQVAMSRAETGAVLVPDLPLRLHPGLEELRQAFASGAVGEFRGLRLEASSHGGVNEAFSRVVDAVRALLGEVEAVTATGEPDAPGAELIVQLRCAQSRRAEVRVTSSAPSPLRLTLSGSAGARTLELPGNSSGASRLVSRANDGTETAHPLDPWDPHAAILSTLTQAVASRPVHPDLLDGTRAMEVAEGVARSLRRGRTVELHYEEISEEGTFKSVMTSFGCLILLSILVVLPLALVGPALGMPWTVYVAYVIPPLLVGFALLQLFRFAARGPGQPSRPQT
jgi:predicted dehydrogenase